MKSKKNKPNEELNTYPAGYGFNIYHDIVRKEISKKFQHFWIWKLIIIFNLIVMLMFISLLNLYVIDSNKPTYDYEVRIIELDNNNFFEEIWVEDYICDEGLKVDNIQYKSYIDKKYHYSFYASAWEDAEVHKGICAIKVRKEMEKDGERWKVK